MSLRRPVSAATRCAAKPRLEIRSACIGDFAGELLAVSAASFARLISASSAAACLVRSVRCAAMSAAS